MNKNSREINREQYLIERLGSKHIGDDAAIIGNTLYSMDAFFEDVHFKKEWMSMEQIGRKAMLVNLSDAIAMNAHPQYALVSLSLPKNITTDEIDMLVKSLESCAKEFGCEIIGGDTISAEKLSITITVISQSKNPLTRRGLEEGDYLAYTGNLGESKSDLMKLMEGKNISPLSRFYEPKLRSEFIYCSSEFLNSGMDISDGLFCDTNKLLDINKYGFEPLLDIDDSVGTSGEEYEMLISFSKENKNKIEEIANSLSLPLTVFAKICKNNKRFLCTNHHF